MQHVFYRISELQLHKSMKLEKSHVYAEYYLK